MSLVEKYGYGDIAAALRERGGLPDPEQAYLTGNVENIDDFAACKITRKEDWVDLYAKPYYFGCEADDRMNATAFGRSNPFGSKLSIRKKGNAADADCCASGCLNLKAIALSARLRFT
jgi:hypothetical protein